MRELLAACGFPEEQRKLSKREGKGSESKKDEDMDRAEGRSVSPRVQALVPTHSCGLDRQTPRCS